MPVYLAHGFRWPREGYTGIRVHTIVQNLENVSSEYIQNAHSRAALLVSLRKLYPDVMAELEKPPSGCIDFLEQYDPEDVSESAISQPYAFVCDRVVMIAGGQNAEARASQLAHGGGGMRRASATSPPASPASASASTTAAATAAATAPKKKERKRTLPMSIALPFTEPSAHIAALSLSVEEVTSEGSGAISPEAWAALAELRDNIADGERIGWWVVFNGDPERAFDRSDEEEGDEGDEDDEEEGEEEEEQDVVGEGDKEARSGSVPSSQITVVPVPQSLPLRPPQSPTRTSNPVPSSSSSPPPPPRSPTGGRVPPPVPPPPGDVDTTKRTQQFYPQQQQTRSLSDPATSSLPSSALFHQRQDSGGAGSGGGRSSRSSNNSRGKGPVKGFKKLFGRKS